MNWRCLQLTYELRSPLHIGYHKAGNVQRTRCYIPARNLWGAVTERLTRSGFSVSDAQKGNYQVIGRWLKLSTAFSYFYVYGGDKLFYPHYSKEGLRYGSKTLVEFERAYLDAHVTTALEAVTTTAETGSLHEVEYIAPYRLDRDGAGRRTLVRGLVFLSESAWSKLNMDTWELWLRDLRVGGERRYGFGQLRLKDIEEVPADWPKGYALKLEGCRPGFKVKSGTALLAHTVARTAARDLRVRGVIEPLVGRGTAISGSFGRNLTRGLICWVPGSLLEKEDFLLIDVDGYWDQHS
jgi:hypothetical protein